MITLMISVVGSWAVWFSYNFSLEKGKHRRKKRGVWDYGMRRKKMTRGELRMLTENLRAERGWSGWKWEGGYGLG